MRMSEIKRKTAETDISLKVDLDGSGKSEIDTGCGFMDHMLTLFARHGRFDLAVTCKGDVKVDYHHSVEDLGIVLGSAFAESLGDMRGIERYADIILPMDETLMLCAVDISGRDYLGFDVSIPAAKVGDFDTELVKEFFLGFVRKAAVTLHFKELAGENTHHIIEAMFKAFGRTMAKAVKINEEYEGEIPSTKGVL
ncbi:MAG: imidazoleglycerol-phosphate dehydratase HisB [Emergencia timonensis]|uniref:imidazoleglycerol-phosphate dehydratase HisB n=1 Tax=Emergencia timonensis TaxID=1776384 RepID=UPI000835EAA0|nr:imidazoleglycerol-phosphate dehydratase HisB [Emergencia timonensis]WNX90206.1 imidazoleglycerol-phosphate dehydratase HisB [Emergencia timonensis]